MGAGAVAGSIAGAVLPVVGDIINNATNWRIAQENRNLQRETNAQNEALMREAWARDDTARQRMVADLEQAGFSKWLASGASPMTSSPISLTAPQNNYNADFGAGADALAHAYSNYQNMVRTEVETENAKETGEVIKNQVDESEARARIAKHDADVFDGRADVASTDPANLKYLAELIKGLKGQSQIGQDVKNGFGQLKEAAGDLKEYFSPEAKAERKEKRELKKDEKYEKRYTYPRRQPMSMSDWAKANQIKLGSYQAAKLYDEYKHNFLRDAK